MQQAVHTKGFTLIETLVYLALLSLVFTGLFAAGFAIVESLDAMKTRAIVQEEGNFIMAKLNWAVTNAKSADVIASPLALKLNNPPSPVISYDSAQGYLEYDGEPLNSLPVYVENVTFSATSTDPMVIPVKTQFTLWAKTPTGKDYRQDFEVTNYLRK